MFPGDDTDTLKPQASTVCVNVYLIQKWQHFFLMFAFEKTHFT